MTGSELYHQDGKSAGIWYCLKCRCVAKTKDDADQCCQPRTCPECGGECRTYQIRCDKCSAENLSREEAERMAKAELVTDYDGWVMADGYGYHDGWFDSVESLAEHCETNEITPPEFAYCANNVGVPRADLEDIIEPILADMGEDADEGDLRGIDDLQAAIDAFNEANKSVEVWQVDHSRKVRVRA